MWYYWALLSKAASSRVRKNWFRWIKFASTNKCLNNVFFTNLSINCSKSMISCELYTDTRYECIRIRETYFFMLECLKYILLSFILFYYTFNNNSLMHLLCWKENSKLSEIVIMKKIKLSMRAVTKVIYSVILKYISFETAIHIIYTGMYIHRYNYIVLSQI